MFLCSVLYKEISFTTVSAAEGITAFTFFMGPGSHSEVQKISFRPEDGLLFREKYEKKYGPKGKDLIERFGLGLGSDGPPVLDPDHFLNKVCLFLLDQY